MATNPDREYHMERARSELDCAYRAEAQRAAEAHLRLSALHMEQLKHIEGAGAEAGSVAHAGEESATRGHVIKTPHDEEPYKVVLEHEEHPDSGHPVSFVQDGEELIREVTPTAPKKPRADSWNP